MKTQDRTWISLWPSIETIEWATRLAAPVPRSRHRLMLRALELGLAAIEADPLQLDTK